MRAWCGTEFLDEGPDLSTGSGHTNFLMLALSVLPGLRETLCALPRHQGGSLGAKCGHSECRVAVVLILSSQYDCSVQAVHGVAVFISGLCLRAVVLS